MPPKRYFEDERSAKPGTISEELRAAIDLHPDKLPIWIYKMRVLGYPPGWLHQADISNSSLQLFDDSSQARSSTSKVEEAAAFNPECFVEFPGFNAPLPEGVQDHCEFLGMPPMQVWQQLNYVKQTIPPPKPVPYKRIKLSSRDDSEEKTPKKNTSQIEDEDEDDEIQIIEPSNDKENTHSDKEEEEREEGEASDSDDDVIAISVISGSSKKKPKSKSKLTTTIEKISDGSQSTNQSQSSIEKSFNNTNINVPSSKESRAIEKDSAKDNGLDSEQESFAESEQQSFKEKSSNTSLCKSPTVKLIGLGSPLPANIDSKKPPLEKFAVGMGELIYFENLPTSTGVFDKMRNVICKVRKKLSE